MSSQKCQEKRDKQWNPVGKKEYFYNNKKEIKGADFAFKYFHLDLRIVGIKITLLFGSQNI